jgi:hypothetical protein
MGALAFHSRITRQNKKGGIFSFRQQKWITPCLGKPSRIGQQAGRRRRAPDITPKETANPSTSSRHLVVWALQPGWVAVEHGYALITLLLQGGSPQRLYEPTTANFVTGDAVEPRTSNGSVSLGAWKVSWRKSASFCPLGRTRNSSPCSPLIIGRVRQNRICRSGLRASEAETWRGLNRTGQSSGRWRKPATKC